MSQESPIIFSFSGGNALGAYHGGVYDALCEAGVQPDWIIGASIGAVTGAIIAGNPPEERLNALRRYWRLACIDSPPPPPWIDPERYNGAHLLQALLLGRPGLFGSRFPGPLSLLPGMPDDVAMLDHHPMEATLHRFVDFERLNGGEVRLTIGCLDIETGEEVYFDSSRDRITARHLLASTGVMPLFPPVEIDGRLLGDLVYRNNMPLDVGLTEMAEREVTCIASELFTIQGRRPIDLPGTLDRGLDLLCAGQTQRTVEALRREHALRGQLGLPGKIDMLHVVHRAAPDERHGKALNFAGPVLAERWRSGLSDMRAALARWRGQARQDRFTYIGPVRDAASS
ncbi:patatin-like phospholipase family protein [Niveispirillum sp. KHB5.9]|uniref:patatin-like phospholipase family protein n=1 Tax=Niveispirillum sp. KHB5.9 TaxID=3400269 RepID=UPI003A83C4D9